MKLLQNKIINLLLLIYMVKKLTHIEVQKNPIIKNLIINKIKLNTKFQINHNLVLLENLLYQVVDIYVKLINYMINNHKINYLIDKMIVLILLKKIMMI